jgi:hypothetical protein
MQESILDTPGSCLKVLDEQGLASKVEDQIKVVMSNVTLSDFDALDQD